MTPEETIEMYEDNLTARNKRVRKIAIRIMNAEEEYHLIPDDKYWNQEAAKRDWNELLADMEAAVRDAQRSRLALSVALTVANLTTNAEGGE